MVKIGRNQEIPQLWDIAYSICKYSAFILAKINFIPILAVTQCNFIVKSLVLRYTNPTEYSVK